MQSLIIFVKKKRQALALILADINEIPSYDKTRALFQPDYLRAKSFPLFIYLYKIPSKVWKGEEAPFLFWHDILGPHFTLSSAGECLAYIPSTSHANAIFSAALYGYLTS